MGRATQLFVALRGSCDSLSRKGAGEVCGKEEMRLLASYLTRRVAAQCLSSRLTAKR